MRVLFLTEWFDPTPAHKGLSFVSGLRDAGYKVEVATTFASRQSTSLYRREIMNGIVVHRLPHYHSHDSSGLRRSLTYLSFFASALLFGMWRGRHYDAIYAYHPPITVGFAAVLFSGFWRKPVVLDVLDLWPDVLISSGMVHPVAVRVLSSLCNFVYRRSKFISVPTKGFRSRLVSGGVPESKISLIYNFADETKCVASGDLDLSPFSMSGRFNVVYGGNFGRFQQLETLIAAAKLAFKENPRIQLILIGSGSHEKAVRFAAANSPEIVRIHSPLPMSQIGNVFAAADLLAVTLADNEVFRIYLPQKLQFYLAMGKPILAALSGEGADVIAEAGAGFAVQPGDPQALAAAMVGAAAIDTGTLKALGHRGREFYLRTMSSEIATRQLGQLLMKAAQQNGTVSDNSQENNSLR